MARISLRIRRGRHGPSIAAGHPVEAIRLVTRATFATASGWTPFREFVIDTGAPVSLIPPSIWRLARIRTLGQTNISGIARHPECQIPATLAEVECLLSDGPNVLGPTHIYAYLAEIDQAPALIGMSGFIKYGALQVNIARDDAFIEM